MGPERRRTIRRGCAALLAALLAAPTASPAGDLRGAQVDSLRGDLRGVRSRMLHAPRASIHDYKQLQRWLAEQRVETRGDPRLGELELQRRHALWQAERAVRQGRAAAGRGRLEAARDRLDPPGHLRAPTDLDLHGAALPIGTAKRFLFIQRGLREARADLDRGRAAAAAARLASAESGLRELRTGVDGDDPNLIALAAEIASLRARLEAVVPCRLKPSRCPSGRSDRPPLTSLAPLRSAPPVLWPCGRGPGERSCASARPERPHRNVTSARP